MKRSEINIHLKETLEFFKAMKVHLPKWGYWGIKDWKAHHSEIREIINNGLGWDITDFGSDNFDKVGLINFNPRNGSLEDGRKTYCEKIIVVGEDQVLVAGVGNDEIHVRILAGAGS